MVKRTNIKMTNKLCKSLMKQSTSLPSTSISNPSKVGSVGVKTPKSKKMPDALSKPSLFFKSEDIKHSSVRKLNDFLQKRQLKIKN